MRPGRGARRVGHDRFFPRRDREASDEIAPERIRRKLRAVRHEDYYAILELRRGADGPAIREAYRRQIESFAPSRLPPDLAHKYLAELHEIRDALEDAWAVLGDASLREAYLAHTTR
jgi:preprotein translocase subunit Sec63